MKQFQLGQHSLGVVEVPEDAYRFQIAEPNYSWQPPRLDAFTKDNSSYLHDYTFKLPSGQWELLGRAGEISIEVMDKVFDMDVATFLSFLQDNNIDKKNLLIIKK